MQHFYVWRFDKKRRIIGLALLFIVAFFIFATKPIVSLLMNKPEPTVLLKGSSEKNNIALTFNISWGEKRVSNIIDVLQENDVQATFFVSGEWAERHPDHLKKITESNHELGMLGYRYKNYVEQEIDQVRNDLIYARDIFQKLGFENVKLLRTPSGQFNKEIVDLAKSFNFEVVHWSVNTYDWERPGVDSIIQTTLEETKNGDIILMHASDSAEQTADALKVILPELKNKDFNFVSITELMNQINIEKELVED